MAASNLRFPEFKAVTKPLGKVAHSAKRKEVEIEARNHRF